MRAAVENYMSYSRDVISVNRSYYMVDFNDFLDYATSEIVKYEGTKIPESEVLLYDALPGTYDKPLFDGKDGEISIVGCA